MSVYVDEVPEGLRFSVRDTGRGIPEEELGAIFTKFWSGGASSTGNGSGLGLWIACAILEAHGSRLTVESQVGKGTTFGFTLPFDTASRDAKDAGADRGVPPASFLAS